MVSTGQRPHAGHPGIPPDQFGNRIRVDRPRRIHEAGMTLRQLRCRRLELRSESLADADASDQIGFGGVVPAVSEQLPHARNDAREVVLLGEWNGVRSRIDGCLTLPADAMGDRRRPETQPVTRVTPEAGEARGPRDPTPTGPTRPVHREPDRPGPAQTRSVRVRNGDELVHPAPHQPIPSDGCDPPIPPGRGRVRPGPVASPLPAPSRPAPLPRRTSASPTDRTDRPGGILSGPPCRDSPRPK
jgi:hypothetical protein